ncbi:hypothetical protein GALL_121680 [mine drainage metagenome]|uniref:Uncharacterized protein n=1 Tax=mine drainage metagenome TaxID=410659 RepID=A0A1J5SNT6_9ZZZZ
MTRRKVLYVFIFLLAIFSANKSFGQYADLGTGNLKNQIWWFDWNGFSLNEGASKTFTTTDGLTVKIVFSKVSGQTMLPSVMNTWSGAVLHYLYDFSNSSIKPALYDLTTTSSFTSNYSLNITATRNGVPTKFTFVAADAEASAINLEYTTLKTDGTNWTTIDFFRNSSQTSNPLSGCGTNSVVITDTYGGVVGIGQNPVLATDAQNNGVLNVDVSLDEKAIKGGGMGMAFGIFAPVDMGDLPASFGSASHALQYVVNNACNYNTPFPSLVQNTNIKLGNIAGDADATDTTDDNMRGVADEEAIQYFPIYDGKGTYSLTLKLGNTSGGPVYLSGWFDSNNNGKFELNEMTLVTVPNNSINAVITWTGLPANISASFIGFRFRISSDILAVQSPVGFAKDGEVEDYLVQIMRSQNVIASFIAPDTVCVNTSININNNSVGASSYYWNFCVADIHQLPVGNNLGNPNSILNTPVYMDYTFANGNYYGFVTNNYPGGLVRLDYGNSLLNTPIAHNLGTLNGVIQNTAEGVQIVNNGNQWYVIIVGGDITGGINPYIIAVSLGTDITNNSPTAVNWGNIGNLSYPHKLYVFNDNGHWYGITANTSNSTITRFDFGSDISNAPSGTNLGNIGNLSSPTGLQVINENGLWYLFVTNAVGSTLSRLDFGNSLLNTPTGVNLGNPNNLLSTGWDIYIMKYCGSNVAYIINANTTIGQYDIVKLDFAGSLLNTPTAVSMGNIGNLNFPHSLSKIFRVNNDLYSFITNVRNNSLSRLQFQGCTNSSNANSTAQTPPLFTYNQSGIYNINLTIDEGLASQTSICKQIVVKTPERLSISKDTSICKGDSVQLKIVGGKTYQWSPSLSLSNSSINNPIAYPVNQTKYFVTVNDKAGCIQNDSITISIIPVPTFSLQPSSENLCYGDSVTLTASGGDSYQWLGSTDIQNIYSPVVIVKPTVSTTYPVCIFSKTCNVKDTLKTIVTVNPIPNISITKSNDLDCFNGSAFLNANGGTQYNWSPSDGLSSPIISNPEVKIIQTTKYTVTVTSSNGCSSTDTVTVKVINNSTNQYLVPNAFTPNGDGLNDCFGIKGWGVVLNFEFSIFNRWGERIFFTTDPSNCWNGNYKSIPQSMGTFIYKIKAKTLCGDVERNGTLVLLR